MPRIKTIRKDKLLVLFSQLIIFLENRSEKVGTVFFNFYLISDLRAGMFIFLISLSNLVLFLGEKVSQTIKLIFIKNHFTFVNGINI